MDARKVLVVGSSSMDLVLRVSRMPRSGETVIGQSFQTVSGGKGANQAVAAARLGGEVSLIACLGDDLFGRQQLDNLTASGVDVSHVRTVSDAPTGVAMILVGESGESSIVVASGANFCLRASDVLERREVFQNADAVLLQLETPLGTVEASLRMARECGALAILDAGPARNLSPEMLGLADIVSPNETEAETLTGIAVDTMDGVHRAAQELLDMGVDHVVLKLGDRGSYYLGPTGELHVPAFPVEAVDTTAAGDAFTAALALRWDPARMRETLRYANAAGALASRTEGAQPSMPLAAAVDSFLAANPGD